VRVAESGNGGKLKPGCPCARVNVIRRGLGSERIALVSAILREAIDYALDHRDEVIRALAAEQRGEAALAETALLDRYLAMYANEDTRVMAPDVRRAIEVLFDRAAKAGLLPRTARSNSRRNQRALSMTSRRRGRRRLRRRSRCASKPRAQTGPRCC